MSILNVGGGRVSCVENASGDAKLWVISNKHNNGPPESRSGEVAIRVAFSKLGVASGSLASCVLEGEVPMNRPISMESPLPAVLMTCRTT
jgi:hypothetical protein